MLEFGSIGIESSSKKKESEENGFVYSRSYAREYFYYHRCFIFYLQNDSMHSTEMIRLHIYSKIKNITHFII